MNDATAPSSQGTILVVDDDRLVLATVTHGLAQAGYDVIDADNGDDAILLARQRHPALALLDIRMEGKTGFDVAEYLRDVAGVPFMFLSAFADEPTRAKVAELGAKAYLVKPLDVGQIVPTVNRVMAELRAGGGALPSTPASSVPTGASAAAAAEKVTPAVVQVASSADAEPLALATGILMHRHTLTRAGALQKLHALAAERGVSPLQQAQRLVDAVEVLADADR